MPWLTPAPTAGIRVADLSLVWIAAGVPERLPLAPQIPAAVALYLQGAQPLPVRLQPLGAQASGCSRARSWCGRRTFDPTGDALVAHIALLTPARVRPERFSQARSVLERRCPFSSETAPSG